MKELLQRSFLWGVAGMLIGPAAVYCVMLFVLWTDQACRSGVSANCKLDVWLNLSMAVGAGFVLFFGVTVVRGLLARAREAME